MTCGWEVVKILGLLLLNDYLVLNIVGPVLLPSDHDGDVLTLGGMPERRGGIKLSLKTNPTHFESADSSAVLSLLPCRYPRIGSFTTFKVYTLYSL